MKRKKRQFVDDDDDDVDEEEEEYKRNILYEMDMSTEKRVNPKNYITDMKRRKHNHWDEDNYRLRLSILEARLKKIYDSLEFSNVIKATPIITFVYSKDTKKSHDYILAIYNKWINYLSLGCRNSQGLNFTDIFHNIDYYIFNNYFKEYAKHNKLDIIVISNNNNNVINNGDNENKEYVSIVIEGNKIVARYVPEVLIRVCEDSNNNNNNNNNQRNDMQLTNNLHSHLSKNKSLIDQLDNRGMFVKFSPNKRRLINDDRRFVILGSERPLFNTTVITPALNNLNNTLHNIGAAPLNFSIPIFHAMLHLRCFIETGSYSLDHDVRFIQELLNFTPSVLFGHSLLPNVTISMPSPQPI